MKTFRKINVLQFSTILFFANIIFHDSLLAQGPCGIIANAGPDVTLTCSNPTANLVASGGVNYLWSNGATTASTTVSTSAYAGFAGSGQFENSIYTVTVSDAAGCTAVDQVNVTSSFYTFKVGCTDSWKIGFSGLGSSTYLWSTGETTSQIQVSPTIDTWYYLTAISTVSWI
ncbi:MAG: hypothetical protein ACOYOA_16150, partial [Saprospiraceae bacterium]